jgi:hypothetical protein
LTRRAADLMRWKLELAGTSLPHAQALEAVVDEIGWTRHDTEVNHDLGVTRVYVTTEPGESAEHLAVELAERLTYGLPTITAGIPTTWPVVFARLASVRLAREASSSRQRRGRPARPQPLPGPA